MGFKTEAQASGPGEEERGEDMSDEKSPEPGNHTPAGMLDAPVEPLVRPRSISNAKAAVA